MRVVLDEVPSEVYRGNTALALWHCGWDTSRVGTDQQETTTMTMTPNSSKILGLLRRSPRSSDATPTPAKTPPGDLDISGPEDISFQSIKADAKLGAFETSIAVFREAASLASNIPYMGAVAGIIVQIIRIRGVRTVFLFFSSQEHFG